MDLSDLLFEEMKIYLPHIHYTVYTKPLKAHPSLKYAQAWTERTNRNTSTIYLPKKTNDGDLAHELIHVLQFICEDRNMNFLLEQEHTAYIMQYLMGKIRGYTWA